ncbi:DUF4429 domain-containing protein [Streptomyces sp. NPDC048639]|uniref:DUF4429 domain-containing protein n=1 Tax=Streptomyces sp. NPDC048639 TaxID=3365581 RepID=UPI00372375A9
MTEIIQRDGTWTFDGETVRIVPGHDKSVNLLRRTLGELAVPLEALAGIAYEPGKKTGRLRLRLRDGADPLLQVTAGKLPDAADPYQLAVEADRAGVAEYMVDEVRNAMLLEQVPSEPCTHYLMPGPSVPLTVSAGDGVVAFDGGRIRLDWTWKTDEVKQKAGPRVLTLDDLAAIEWTPASGLENGCLRFIVSAASPKPPAKYDPHALVLFGFRKDPLTALVAAAVAARMPHPAAPAVPETLTATADGVGSADLHDELLRRLRELGELHRSGVLTEEEFTVAKQAVLKRF